MWITREHDGVGITHLYSVTRLTVLSREIHHIPRLLINLMSLNKRNYMSRVTAVFDDRTQAEQAVTELRRLGVTDTDLSFIARNEEDAVAAGASTDTAGKRAAKGAAAGAGAGLLFGLAALAIPGVGPFITASALASALGTTGGALAAGAIVGGTSGAIAGGLSKAGYSKDEAEFYGPAVERGGVLVAVETEGMVTPEQTRQVLSRHGGKSYDR